MHVGVVGFNCQGKAKVGKAVLVCTVDQGVVRERGQSLDRLQILRGLTFEHAPTTCGEQGVAAEQRVSAAVGDVAQGVAGYRDHLNVTERCRDALVIVHWVVDGRDARQFAARAVDRSGPDGGQPGDSADVIGVMVGDQNTG